MAYTFREIGELDQVVCLARFVPAEPDDRRVVGQNAKCRSRGVETVKRRKATRRPDQADALRRAPAPAAPSPCKMRRPNDRASRVPGGSRPNARRPRRPERFVHDARLRGARPLISPIRRDWPGWSGTDPLPRFPPGKRRPKRGRNSLASRSRARLGVGMEYEQQAGDSSRLVGISLERDGHSSQMWPEVGLRPRTGRGRQQVEPRPQGSDRGLGRVESFEPIGQRERRVPESGAWINRQRNHPHHSRGRYPLQPGRIDRGRPAFGAEPLGRGTSSAPKRDDLR